MGAAVFWLVIAICVFAIDILTSNFCFTLFSVGAVAAAVCGVMEVPFIIQIIVFSVLNIISFAIGYPLLKKKFKVINERIPLMEETYVGKIMISEKEIRDKAQVKVGGEYWTVVNEGDMIHKGDQFTITGIEGIKLKIKKIQED
ncbi:NfeD family protein [Clostridium beijerinckii]|uniref:NfeD family protein n=1 Tax=Clostridium beijerinckii TaxID=1520 RepID=UPI00080A6BA4|nr:NfeD family protein [Clostridium beijerinckii]OCA99825.1 nodulation efficiency protein D [Clostridium beijerinckii]